MRRRLLSKKCILVLGALVSDSCKYHSHWQFDKHPKSMKRRSWTFHIFHDHAGKEAHVLHQFNLISQPEFKCWRMKSDNCSSNWFYIIKGIALRGMKILKLILKIIIVTKSKTSNKSNYPVLLIFPKIWQTFTFVVNFFYLYVFLRNSSCLSIKAFNIKIFNM